MNREHLEQEFERLKPKLLEIGNGRELATAAWLFGIAATWSLRSGVSEELLVEKIFAIARALDKEHLDG